MWENRTLRVFVWIYLDVNENDDKWGEKRWHKALFLHMALRMRSGYRSTFKMSREKRNSVHWIYGTFNIPLCLSSQSVTHCGAESEWMEADQSWTERTSGPGLHPPLRSRHVAPVQVAQNRHTSSERIPRHVFLRINKNRERSTRRIKKKKGRRERKGIGLPALANKSESPISGGPCLFFSMDKQRDVNVSTTAPEGHRTFCREG